MSTSHAVKHGVTYGFVVGLFFAVMEMIGAAAMGAPALSPWRAFAGTVLGKGALDTIPLSTALPVGIIAHFTLSIIYGVVYALVFDRMSEGTRRSYGTQTLIGFGFGMLLYLANFQVIARVIYPWFREANQPWQFILHTVCFGVPLALLLAMQERREERRRVVPHPA